MGHSVLRVEILEILPNTHVRNRYTCIYRLHKKTFQDRSRSVDCEITQIFTEISVKKRKVVKKTCLMQEPNTFAQGRETIIFF